MCHPPGDSDSESVTIAFWLHLPTQRYIGCHGFTKSLQTQMTQTHIPSFTDFFLMKTQEWKDCYAYRNIGIRGSNAKYETGMKELSSCFSCNLSIFAVGVRPCASVPHLATFIVETGFFLWWVCTFAVHFIEEGEGDPTQYSLSPWKKACCWSQWQICC